jgi:hypothetical protein
LIRASKTRSKNQKIQKLGRFSAPTTSAKTGNHFHCMALACAVKVEDEMGRFGELEGLRSFALAGVQTCKAELHFTPVFTFC